MKGTFIGLVVALMAILCIRNAHAIDYGDTPQQFMAGSSQTGKAGRERVQRRSEVPLTTFSIGLGGSWLEANLGASRPQGAPGPWCGYAMRLEVMSMGRPDPGPAYNAVRAWHDYGTPAPRAAVGSLFISREHISKVVEGECPPGRVRTISGNAIGARVTYMCEPLSSLVVSRWP